MFRVSVLSHLAHVIVVADDVTRPSLMGAHTGPQIGDAPLQAKVMDTILVNATAIFDED